MSDGRREEGGGRREERERSARSARSARREECKE